MGRQRYRQWPGGDPSCGAVAEETTKSQRFRTDFETTYGGAFNEYNSVKNRTCSEQVSCSGIRRQRTDGRLVAALVRGSSEERVMRGGVAHCAAAHTGETVNQKFFSRMTSFQHIGAAGCPKEKQHGAGIRPNLTWQKPAWGVSDGCSTCVPGPSWTCPLTEASVSMQSVYKTSYQYRARTADVLAEHAQMLQVANATRQSVSLRAPDPLLDGRHNSCFTDGVLGRKKEQADRNEGEKSRAGSPESRCLNEDDAASPHVRHLQDGAEKTGVLREEKWAELNAGLNAFQESFYMFEPNKLRVNPGVPYCKPWQPLAELRYDVPSDDSFDHREPSTAADGFVSLSPAARFDNAAAGLERKGLGI